MNFKMVRQYRYNNDKHYSKTINYKAKNLATIKTMLMF